MAQLTPDIAEAARFLVALDPDPNATYGFATFDDSGFDFRLALRLYGTLDQAIRLTGRKKGQLCSTVSLLAFMQRLGAGVFVTVQHLDGAGATAQHVDRTRALINDADSDEQIASLNRFIAASGLVPSIVVASGGRTANGADKLQVYWRVHDCPVAAFTELQSLLLSRTGTDPSTKDLARVLRLVGFHHLKGEPRLTRIVSTTDREYYCSEFERRVRAQPQIAELPSTPNASNRGARRGGTATQVDVNDRTARLRTLLDRYGGLITPAVHTLLREAQARGESAPGNRHDTFVAIVARLAQCKWPDADIGELVLPIANTEWADGDWRAHLDRVLAWVRAREAAAFAAAPGVIWPGRAASEASVSNRPVNAGGPT